MKREIKFRAWDSVNKVMELNIHQLDSLNEILHKEKYGIMQYTGLKDCNGKEIYEGDILKIETDKPMVVGWSEKFASFVLNRKGWAFSHWFGEACDADKCEIIGNIYENPELLEK